MLGMVEKLSNLFVGKHGGVTNSELEDLHFHNPFSNYLPWVVYDPSTRLYINADDTWGFLWECSPLCFSGEKTVQIAEAILRVPLPVNSVVQFILHGDPDIKSFIRGYEKYREGGDELIQEATKNYVNFLKRSTRGLPQTANIPLRNFRLFVSAKFPANSKGVNLPEIHALIQEVLSGMALGPVPMEPPRLLDWLRRVFNDDVTDRMVSHADGSKSYVSFAYSDECPINKQVILSETEMDVTDNYIRLGKRYLRCITPKTYPSEVDPLRTNELFGGIWGLRSDSNQHRSPFLYCLNIIYEDLKTNLRNKCDLVLQQRAAGSFGRTLQKKQDEYQWATDRLDQGERFVKIMPIMFIFGDSVEQMNDGVTRAKRMWEETGFFMQEDRGILPIMFLNTLPFGLRNHKRNLQMLERDTIVSGEAVANILPVQGGYAGSQEPVIIFQDRKGQICPISIFSKKANNYNGLVLASSGAGKSFFMNGLAYSLYSTNVRLRIIDIGKSYEKLTKLFGGKFIDFAEDEDICLNPFSSIVDIEEDLAAIGSIVCMMVYSGVENAVPTANEVTLAQDAVRWAYEKEGTEASVDLVYEYLKSFPVIGDGEFQAEISNEEIIGCAHRMAFNMRKFTSEGAYGKYFNGKSTFNIASDNLLCLELDALKGKPDLFRVVTLLVLDAVTKDLYLSDRSNRRMVLFDEAWQFISGDNVMMQNIIESGFRRARKYNGAFWVISQSLMDLQKFGQIGTVLWNNADFRCLLESKDFAKAEEEKIIDYDRFTMDLLKSLKTVKEKGSSTYSEIFVDTPFGKGIVRFSVDDFNYFMYTSDPDECAEINSLVNAGMSPKEAIYEMVRRYRGG